MDKIIQIIIWVVLIGAFVFFFMGGRKNKKKYAGRSMAITEDWFEQSQSKYSQDSAKKAYYFQYDKNYMTQGHLMVDRNRRTIYEAKILYGDPVGGYEADFTNHLITYTHHHKLGAVSTTEAFDGGIGATLTSTFKFDGENIWKYIRALGYDYHFQRVGMLAYQVDVMKNGEQVGTIYSSNNGKNYFGCDGPIEAKAGSKGLYVIECADRDMDGLFLLAVAFTKTELSIENLK